MNIFNSPNSCNFVLVPVCSCHQLTGQATYVLPSQQVVTRIPSATLTWDAARCCKCKRKPGAAYIIPCPLSDRSGTARYTIRSRVQLPNPGILAGFEILRLAVFHESWSIERSKHMAKLAESRLAGDILRILLLAAEQGICDEANY